MKIIGTGAHLNCRCVAMPVRAPLPIYALRMLVRNDEARIEFLTEWINGLQPGDHAPSLEYMQQSLDNAHAALVRHSTELRTRISPAAPSLVNAAPSSGAVRPDSLTTS